MKGNTAAQNDEPESMTQTNEISSDRVHSGREELLADLQARVKKLEKTLKKEQDKITQYKNKVSDAQQEAASRMGKVVAEGRGAFEGFVRSVIELWEKNIVPKRDLETLRSLCLGAMGTFGLPSFEVPEWFLDPSAESGDFDTAEEEFDFGEPEAGESTKGAFDEDFYEDDFAKSEAERERNLWYGTKGGISNQVREQIRPIYIRLAAAAHPDRATNEEARAHRTVTMQRINEAYRLGDVARLLQIEKEWQEEVTRESERSLVGGFTRFVEDEIKRLESVFTLLNGQLRRTKDELKELKNSSLGQFFRDEERMRKDMGVAGIDFALEGAVQMRQMMAELSGHIERVIQKKLKVAKFSARLKEICHGDEELDEFGEISEEEMFEMMMEDLFEEFSDEGNSPRGGGKKNRHKNSSKQGKRRR